MCRQATEHLSPHENPVGACQHLLQTLSVGLFLCVAGSSDRKRHMGSLRTQLSGMLTLGLGWEGLALLQVGVTEKTGSQFSSEG